MGLKTLENVQILNYKQRNGFNPFPFMGYLTNILNIIILCKK
jgi:hypothetical protein